MIDVMLHYLFSFVYSFIRLPTCLSENEFSNILDHLITMPQVLSMKAEYLILLSFLMTFAVVTNAFYTKKQFYPSVVYLTKSSTSLAVNSFGKESSN
jgi:hypothetical protein